MQHDGELDDFVRVIEKWLEQQVLPDVLEFEHSDTYPAAMVEQMQEFGLFGATIPRESWSGPMSSGPISTPWT